MYIHTREEGWGRMRLTTIWMRDGSGLSQITKKKSFSSSEQFNSEKGPHKVIPKLCTSPLKYRKSKKGVKKSVF